MNVSENELRNIYCRKALAQIPRLLSQQDRNEFSPTYGCFYRIYWHDRALDFPSALSQFGTHALALIYSHPFPGNPYYRNSKIREWALAGMDFGLRIQHRDGTFDEFYPNERGWAGPTAFLIYAFLSSYELLKEETPDSLTEKLRRGAYRSALSLARFEEEGVLANHHALAILALYKSYQFLNEEWILQAIRRKIERLKGFASQEGWFLEYDGADIGYLTATVSFLGKLFKAGYQDKELLEMTKKSVEFCSYFIYPDHSFGGSIGSRQTAHFYPDGFEILARESPVSFSILDKILRGIEQGTIVSPEIQADRYFLYRLPEFLEAWLGFTPRPQSLPLLPYEGKDFNRYFDQAGIQVFKKNDAYGVCNYKKGGVLKLFSIPERKLLHNDTGMTGISSTGQMISTQWIGSKKEIKAEIGRGRISVRGSFHQIPTPYLTPLKMVLFRLALIGIAWNLRWTAWLKGFIRRKSIFGGKQIPVHFQREITLSDTSLKIEDRIWLSGKEVPRRMKIGGEFLLRYVPQSRYFMPHELREDGRPLSRQELEQLRTEKALTLTREIQLAGPPQITPHKR